MSDQKDQAGAAATVRASVVGGFVLALLLVLILQTVRSRTIVHTTPLTITEYADGRVEATAATLGEPHDAVVVGRGMVMLRFDEQRLGWPTATTIRWHPVAIQITPIVGGGGLVGPVTSAQRQAIVEALRQGGNAEALKAFEGRPLTVERRWWGWAVNVLGCWVIAAAGIQGMLGLIAHIRETRGKLRTWEGQCPSCGYDLSGHPAGKQCPECGAAPPHLATYWAGRKGHGRS